MFIHTVHLLQSLPAIKELAVADILHKLIEMEGGHGQPIALHNNRHVTCWAFEDMLGTASAESAHSKPPGSSSTASWLNLNVLIHIVFQLKC